MRKFLEQVWDVLADERNREGLTFDIQFYDEQRVTWKSQMEIPVNPEFEKEIEDIRKQKKPKQRKSSPNLQALKLLVAEM